MNFQELQAETLENWLESIVSSPKHRQRVVVVVSGYEARARYWSSRVTKHLEAAPSTKWVVAGFTDRKGSCSRPINDRFYAEAGLDILEFPGDEADGICEAVTKAISDASRRAPRSPIEVHIDYSSMPRIWYCSLFRQIHEVLRRHDSLFMWYAGGLYDGAEIPTAGVSDVSLFSGQPTITPHVRTHIFGLGFDRIRASAIFRVLDPQNLVCFYGKPGIRHDYEQRVREDNRDLLAAAQFEFAAPVDDFPVAFSKIADVSREFSRSGDVILVPDGPKPLVLASSLVPEFLNKRGIVSLHVRRRKDSHSDGTDVEATGTVYGFSVGGQSVLDRMQGERTGEVISSSEMCLLPEVKPLNAE